MTRKMALFGLISCLTPGILHAQTQAAPQARPSSAEDAANEDEAYEVEALVVSGARPRGAVVGDIPPEQTLTGADVRALGVSSMNDLLTELAPQTTSGRGGAPVVLLNGRRISSFAEMRDIPTEAIQRVEVLPEEVALKYGYTADQKVVNVVLRRRFHANTGELALGAPTAGGQLTTQGEAGSLRLDGEGRLNLALKYAHSDPLFETDRDVTSLLADGGYGLTGNVTSVVPGGELDPALSALAGAPVTLAAVPPSARTGGATLADFAGAANRPDASDIGSYRTLLPRSDELTLNAVYNRTIWGDVSATVNLGGTFSETVSDLGLARTRLTVPAGDPFSPFAAAVVLSRYRPDLGVLEQSARNVSGHLGFSLNGDAKDWRWTVTGNYDHAETRTLTDRGLDVSALQARLDALDPTFNPFGLLPDADFTVDRARSVSDTGNLQAILNGALFRLPAGDVSTTVKLGATVAGLDSRSVRAGVESSNHLSRQGANAQLTLDLPITKVSANVLPAVGNLSANLNLALEELSDFGGLTTLGYGLTWSPAAPVTFIVSVTDQQGAPSMAQLGNPLVATPDVRVFDFVRGETVDITRLSGGNPDLKAEDRHILKLGATVRPRQIEGLSLNANYFRTRIDDPISAFPATTAEVEAAFPDRFIRDPDGVLLRVDARPVNFAKQESDLVRWGLNYSRRVGKAPPPRAPGAGSGRAEGAGAQRGQAPAGEAGVVGQGPATERASGDATSGAASDRPPGMNLLPGAQRSPGGEGAGQNTGGEPPRDGAGRPPGGFGGGGFRGPPGGGAARLQIGLFHTYHLRERVYLRDGGPALDLLNGDALNAGGGTPEHEVEAQLGFTRMGLGMRLTANWRSSTEVDAGPAAAAGALRFSDQTTVNLRLFANLGARRELVTTYPFLRGSRVTLSVNNLFDSRLRVRDATGATPVNYQPDYLDPLGRSVRLSFRKVFF